MAAAAAKRGLFVLFEGVDRCGKTTQARRLVEALNTRGEKAVFMRFPDRDTTIGTMINSYLTKAAELDDHAVHLLFAANRWEKKDEILGALRAGTHVVMDRYAYSGVAFSSAKPGLDIEWCKVPDAGLPQPDLILFMDISVEQAAARGGFGEERYEKPEIQKAVRGNFATLKAQADAAAAGLWVDVDAVGTMDEVAARIMPLVEAARDRTCGGDAGTAPIRRLWDGAVLE